MTSGPRNIHSPPKGRNGGSATGRGAPGKGPRQTGPQAPDEGWIWGLHAAAAALANPDRRILQALATRNAARILTEELTGDQAGGPDGSQGDASHSQSPQASSPLADSPHTGFLRGRLARLELAEPRAIDALLPAGAVHQGIALRCGPPARVTLEDLAPLTRGLVVVLDGVTDPHNVGAILRSLAAFGGAGLVLQDRRAPPLYGACAKAAVGAADRMPVARVVNIARAVTAFNERGWTSIGLAGDADAALPDVLGDVPATGEPKIVLVLGSEDKGLRPGVAAACGGLARIPLAHGMESLNVSTAGAIALYACAQACGPFQAAPTANQGDSASGAAPQSCEQP